MKKVSEFAALVPLKRGLSREEAAFIVGVSTNTFDKMVVDGELPKPARMRGRVVWDRVQIDRALDKLFHSGDDKEVVDQWANGKA